MKLAYTLSIHLLLLFTIGGSADSSCKKDACYNVVQGTKGPNLASRRADCSSILRTVVDDSSTRTVFSYVSSITSTTTVSISTSVATVTSTSRLPDRQFRRRVSEIDSISHKGASMLLLPRDKIIIKGNKPAYAGACKSNEAYAIACLCAGNKAGQQVTITQTITQLATKTLTSISTSISVTSTTTTSIAPRPTSCAQVAGASCSDDCGDCYIAIDSNSFICTQYAMCQGCGDGVGCPTDFSCALKREDSCTDS